MLGDHNTHEVGAKPAAIEAAKGGIFCERMTRTKSDPEAWEAGGASWKAPVAKLKRYFLDG
jgi:hypothetical protein